MKIVFCMLSVIALACQAPEQKDVVERSALITTRSGMGSAVSLGRGYYLTAKHVVFDDATGKPKPFVLVTGSFKDSAARVLDTLGDIALVRITRDTLTPLVFLGNVRLGEEIEFVQPFSDEEDTSTKTFLWSGRVSRIEKITFSVDRPIFPGASGGGVFNAMNELIGINVETFSTENQNVQGVAIRNSFFKPMLEKHLHYP